MTEAPPRIKHNETLAREFSQRLGIESSCPAVCKQLDSIIVNRRAIFAYGFNGTIIQHKGQRLLAYRYHNDNPRATQLAIARIDDRFNVTINQQIKLNPPPISAEDPHFFIWKDEIHMSWVESHWPGKPLSIVKWGVLAQDSSGYSIVGSQQPKIGNNDGNGMEKNWTFFEHDGELFIIYGKGKLFRLTEDGWKLEMESAISIWPYGDIRGGCIVPWKDKLLRFFHSSQDYEPKPMVRRYYIGACVMESKPPFRSLAISKTYIAQGSEICDMTKEERNRCQHYKQGVVFPGGCIASGDEFLLAVGTNDSGIALLKIKSENLNL